MGELKKKQQAKNSFKFSHNNILIRSFTYSIMIDFSTPARILFISSVILSFLSSQAQVAIKLKLAEGKSDFTLREGLGESPGVPAHEYLGLGYNAITGNPR